MQTEESISCEDEHDHQKICSSMLHERSRTTHPNKLSLKKPTETQKIFKDRATIGNVALINDIPNRQPVIDIGDMQTRCHRN